MVFGVRSAGDRRRHGLGGGAGVQPNALQHAARHSLEFGADHIPVRHEANPMPRHGAVPHHSEHQGPGCAGCGGGVSAAEFGREDHRGGHAHRGPLAAAELAGYCGSGFAQPHPTQFGRGQIIDNNTSIILHFKHFINIFYFFLFLRILIFLFSVC